MLFIRSLFDFLLVYEVYYVEGFIVILCIDIMYYVSISNRIIFFYNEGYYGSIFYIVFMSNCWIFDVFVDEFQ